MSSGLPPPNNTVRLPCCRRSFHAALSCCHFPSRPHRPRRTRLLRWRLGGFGKAVSAACVKAAAGQIDKPKAVVDPYGSERFGLALVTGTAKGAKQTISLICVYDKQKKTVEVGSELSADQVKVTPGR